jgi:histidinol-phosphate aminotransferase
MTPLARGADRLSSLLVPAAGVLPSNAEYLRHLEHAAGDAELIRLASNENSRPPAPAVRDALARAYEGANRSPSSRPPLRLALAERFGVAPESVLVGAGSTELIDATLRTFVRAGDEAILPTPSWPVFRRRLAALEASVVEVPLVAGESSYAYDVDALLASVTAGTKLMVLCSPNNPTGNSMSVEEVRRCADTGIALLVDAAYADFHPDVNLSPLVHEYPNVILSRTFSKAYCLAGLRVGYIVGDASVLDYVERFLVPGSSIGTAALDAGLAALADDDYHDRQVERIGAERERLLSGLRALGARAYDSHGNFVAVDASPHPGRADALVGGMLARGILIRAMSDTIVRITVGEPTETDAVLEAFEPLLAAAV